ncbi:MAG: apolipoprotein N-acyltransferase, partial [Acidimicrobiales bacterium]
RAPDPRAPEAPAAPGKDLPLLARLAAAACGGGLIALSLPPWGWWPLAAVGMAALWLALAGARPWRRAAIGMAAGLAQLIPSLWWALSFTVPGYAFLVVVESAFFAVASAGVPARRGRALAFPALMLLAEASRDSWPLGGLPIGSLQLGQSLGLLLPAARVVGGVGLVGLTACAGVVLGCLARLGWRAWARRGTSQAEGGPEQGEGRRGGARAARARRPTRDLVALLVAATVTVGLPLAGWAAPAGGPAIGSIRVAAVQGGGPRGLRAFESDQYAVYRRQYLPTTSLRPGYGLVLWPEDVISLPGPLSASPIKAQMAALAKSLRTTVVAGVTEDVGASRFRNEVVAWGPQGRVVDSYEKRHRVPFGEYIPWRSVLGQIFNLEAVPRDAIPGTGPGLLRTPAGPLGVMISYEVFFPSRDRAAVQAGGQLLLVPTNTASYSTRQIPAQELGASRLRAVEAGRNLVQASPTGYSALISPAGAVSSRSNLGTQDIVTGVVPLRRGRTLFDRWGEMPDLAACCLAVCGAWAIALADRRRAR